ncbi:MAG: cytochrome c maturation protein CcmE [Aquabacterium sp.]|uniref:cytochrome c maturation protein CcmE n=1 Tax=Aquabacterium sp. TaxID=1872578 RepID=UPI0025C08D6D|nr:cytochrome c maturation protein CcmE [Aquabacterium sp.]MBI3381807.1 cytochrome c maturation protein CcmE [Aquabacterium sp.]
MSPRRQRLLLVALSLSGLALSAWLVLSAFQKNLVFFLTPSQIQAGEAPKGRSFRLGGLVEPSSLARMENGLVATFVVTDQLHRVTVHYKGLLPDLFKEGKGVVAQGHMGPSGLFLADEVLAKHDENYMPPQVGKALARQGQHGTAPIDPHAKDFLP